MTRPLAETKFYRPRTRADLVGRPRLTDPLRAADVRLILVSAPAGSGKTTLLAEWLAARGPDGAVAWLALDDGDAEPGTFWTGVVTALERAVPGAGASAAELLRSPQPPIETALTLVLNEIGTAGRRVDLVLDDYHAAEGPVVDAGLAFLLDHLPPGMRVVIGTRSDPALPLARMRVRGELAEIRAADLRFTRDETAAYLNDVRRLGVTSTDIERLERRTEGWAAALHLAALSLNGRDDVSGFIAGFTGGNRYVVDYLVEEVLARQTATVRGFLLHTSVLDRLTGGLCDAVTGRDDGAATLEALDRGNLFLVPLDDQRRWYRYHHLFGDMLRARLRAGQPAGVPGLHARASRWYEANGEPLPAIRHALAAGDPDRAADLAELAVPALRRSRQEAVIRSWLDLIPAAVIRRRPVLGAAIAGALLASGELDGVDERLRDAESRLTPGGDTVVVDRRELPRLPAAIAMYRAAMALARGDLAATAEHATRAVDRAADDDHLSRAGASGLLGLARWTAGDLAAAYRAWTASAEGLLRAGYIADVFGSAIARAGISLAQGRPGAASRAYADAIDLASRQPGGPPRGIADMYVGLSEIHLLRDELPAAEAALRQAAGFGEGAGLPQNRYRYRVALALLREAQGDPAQAVELLDEAERVYAGDFFPNVRPIPAIRARVRAAHGDLALASSWLRHAHLPGESSYLREYEHVTEARILLADRSAAALGLVDRLLAAAEAGERTGSVIELLVLRALARQARGDLAGAAGTLERALTLAEPEGYVRVFTAEGPATETLLRLIARRRGASPYLRRLLRDPAATPAAGLVEPLSARELDVLRLLRTDLDGPAIARELLVSLNTLRTHTKSIYAKLGVNSRRAAVRRADELGLPRR